MTGQIDVLLDALKGEVDRISTQRAAEDKTEELSELLVDSIHQTLKEIKMGANSEDFQDLTVINFVVSADDAGYSSETIRSFVQGLKTVKDAKRAK